MNNNDDFSKNQAAAAYAQSAIGGGLGYYQQQVAREPAALDKPLVSLKKSIQARATYVAQRIAETEQLVLELPKLLAALNALGDDE